MGDSKVINKFHRLLEECEENHIYQGTILEFIKVDYVPKERYATGMIVTGSMGTHRIEFNDAAVESLMRAWIQDAASLETTAEESKLDFPDAAGLIPG